MMHRQKGMTLIGALTLAILVGAIVFAGIKLTPVYLEYMKVVSVLEGVKEEMDGANATPMAIKNSIEKRLYVEGVRAVKLQDFTIRKDNANYVVRARYEDRATYVANVSFLVQFNKSVEIIR